MYPRKEWLWCPILGDCLDASDVVAGHYFFSYKHGQTNMDAIFGKWDKTKVFSPLNGLLKSQHIEKNFDIGKLAIVPCVSQSNGNLMESIKRWLNSQQREYENRILDPKWHLLDEL